jgi:hypothetical protein
MSIDPKPEAMTAVRLTYFNQCTALSIAFLFIINAIIESRDLDFRFLDDL